MGYLKPLTMIPELGLANPGALDAVHQFVARNTAIGLPLRLVALVGVPEPIIILIIFRFLIEGRGLVLLILSGVGVASLVIPAAFIALEATIVVLMFRSATTGRPRLFLLIHVCGDYRLHPPVRHQPDQRDSAEDQESEHGQPYEGYGYPNSIGDN